VSWEERESHLNETHTSTYKLYSGGRKPIYSGVFRNRQCKGSVEITILQAGN
jgi:hypothetical protein